MIILSWQFNAYFWSAKTQKQSSARFGSSTTTTAGLTGHLDSTSESYMCALHCAASAIKIDLTRSQVNAARRRYLKTFKTETLRFILRRMRDSQVCLSGFTAFYIFIYFYASRVTFIYIFLRPLLRLERSVKISFIFLV